MTLNIPIRAIKKPIPAEIAAFREAGIASMIFLRRGLTVTTRNSRPEINTIASACSQV